MRPGCITMTSSLSEKVNIGRRKIELQEKKVSQQKSVGKILLIVFFNQWGPLYHTLCCQKRRSTRNITSKPWRSSSGMLIRSIQNWRTGGSCTRIMSVHKLKDWRVKTLKTPMLNCHLICCTRQISPCAIFGCLQSSRSISMVVDLCQTTR